MDDNMGLIKCADPAKGLHYKVDDKFIKSGIQCNKDTFTYMDKDSKTKTIQRQDLKRKIAVACVPNCDNSHIIWNDGTNICPSGNKCVDDTKKDEKNNRMMQCRDPSSYIQVNDRRSLLPATCDPLVGWKFGSASDSEIIQDFTSNVYDVKVTLDCIDACPKRITNECSIDPRLCTPAEYDNRKKTYKCPKTHLMRAFIDKWTELLDEVLECKREGLFKETDKISVYQFDPNTVTTQLRVECVSKCYSNFVTMTPADKRKPTNNDILDCNDDTDVLIINDATRVFEELKCDQDGWKLNVNPIAPFTATVHVKAECIKVCDELFLDNKCGDSSKCKKATYLSNKQISCGAQGVYALFVNDQETSGKVSCTKKGWTEENVTPNLVNFEDKNIALPARVNVECRQLCAEALINDLCTGSRKDCIKKTFASDNKLTCSAIPGTYALFVNKVERIEDVTCTRIGWSEKINGAPKTFIDFTNGALSGGKTPEKVEVECRKLCAEELINDLCTGSRQDCIKKTFASDNKLTCSAISGTYALFVNDVERTGNVECTRKGWINGAPQPFIDFTNGALSDGKTPEKVKVECRKLCGAFTFKDMCNVQEDKRCKPTTMNDSPPHQITTCTSRESYALFVNGNKANGEVKCDKDGWKDQSMTPLVNFKDPNYVHQSVQAICRQLCDISLIDDECKDGARDCAKIDSSFMPNQKVICTNPVSHLLFVNGVERTGDVKCTTDGWTETITNTPTKKIVVFTDAHLAAPQNVRVLCKHKCHQDFVDDACQTDDESCSKATYNSETGLLSCADLPNEILVIEIDGKFHESKEGTATCKDEGWLMTSASPPEKPTKFEVHAKCLKVCHPSTLNDQTADPFHKVNYTQLAVGGTLTCNAKEEMLEFDDKATYSDLRCTKEKGWLSTLRKDLPTPLIDFAPMKDLHSIAKFVNVKCVKNLCTARTFKPFCNDDAGNLCQEPDMTSVKYHMKCTTPLVIVKDYNPAVSPITYGDLVCRDGKWFEEKEADSTTAKVLFDDPTQEPVIDVKCIADKCTKCKENLKTIACSDQNCMSISFAAGKSSYCTSYKCASGNAFKFIDGNGVVTYQYNVNNEKAAIWCLGDNRFEYKSTDPSIDVNPRAIKTNDQVGCVKQIPCTEVSPLNLECPSNVLCESDLIKKLQANEKTDKPANNENHVQCAADTADKKYEMFYHDSGTKWRPASNLHCDPTGKWSAAIKKGERLDKIELPSKARIVCANKDPTEDQMIVISICDRCRPDAEEKVKQMKKGKCDGCSSDNGLFFNIEGDACVAKGSDGEIVYGDGETTNKIYCRKTTDGVEWKTNDGKVLAQFAGKESSTKIEYGLIGGITGAFLLIIIIGLAAFFYVKHDQKKKAAALEAAKSKGLTQKIDTIIDEVSVTDDVKTLVL